MDPFTQYPASPTSSDYPPNLFLHEGEAKYREILSCYKRDGCQSSLMLERAKSRREKLDSQKMVLERRSPLQEKIDFNEKSVTEVKTGKQYITPLRKSKLQKLAQFYSSDNENVFLEDEEIDEEEKVPCDAVQSNQCKLGRLNELASRIKQWEDDSNHKKKLQENKEENPKKTMTSEKQNVWDSSMVEKLCSQGFSRSESQLKLIYDFKKNKDQKNETSTAKSNNHDRNPKPGITSKTENPVGGRQEVLRKAALFERPERESSNKPAKDPAELPLMERKALFEKNKGEVVMPKNPFFPERRVPSKISKLEKKENKVNEIRELSSQQTQIERNKNIIDRKVIPEKFPPTQRVLAEPKDCTVKASASPAKGEQTIPDPPPMPTFEQNSKGTPSRNVEEKIQSPSPRSGRLYPSLSSLDISEESGISHSRQDSFNESKNSNLCLNMSLSDLLEMNKNNPTTPPSDHSFSQSKECQVLNKMDKLLEDALNDLSSEYDSDDVAPSPPKMQKSSSFEYKSGKENPNLVLHTVSFYRKQQQNLCTPEGKADDSEETEETKSEEEDESILVQNKIQILIAEVNKQQTIISQASQALNLCLSTVEFSGSGEQVEGERLLLLASHKRQACLNEIQRLKVENSLWSQSGRNFLTDRGDVNLTNISIKLKRDALRSIAAAENLQYFVCLVKSDEQVLATPAVAAIKENLKDMALQFPGQVKLEGLLSNFKIIVEVYNLELGKELLPHDVKYHIAAKKEKKLLTPIKSKKSESKLVKPNIQSPAGPNAVRTSNFQLCGYIVLSLKEITRTQWILNKVPYVSPVEGTISMSIQSQLRLNDEFRGFLTMFDDISGFGAWHRRWCLLSSHFISYWKYPDDETRKVPIGTIDLKSVITENVGSVSRDICARLNTFLLETTRPKLSGDQDSLVMSVKDNVTTIRHLLSADSKHEMTIWCKKLNTALALLRSWKCSSNE